MRLAQIGPAGQERPAVSGDDRTDGLGRQRQTFGSA
jgi:hypothetical protein